MCVVHAGSNGSLKAVDEQRHAMELEKIVFVGELGSQNWIASFISLKLGFVQSCVLEVERKRYKEG